MRPANSEVEQLYWNIFESATDGLIIIDPKRSEVAKRMNIDLPGKYALKVR